jgi:hypothetical protein
MMTIKNDQRLKITPFFYFACLMTLMSNIVKAGEQLPGLNLSLLSGHELQQLGIQQPNGSAKNTSTCLRSPFPELKGLALGPILYEVFIEEREERYAGTVPIFKIYRKDFPNEAAYLKYEDPIDHERLGTCRIPQAVFDTFKVSAAAAGFAELELESNLELNSDLELVVEAVEPSIADKVTLQLQDCAFLDKKLPEGLSLQDLFAQAFNGLTCLTLDQMVHLKDPTSEKTYSFKVAKFPLIESTQFPLIESTRFPGIEST